MTSPHPNYTSPRDSLFNEDKVEKDDFDIDKFNIIDIDINDFTDFFAGTTPNQDATCTYTCKCGHTAADQEDLYKHEAACLERVARLVGNNMEEKIEEERNLAPLDALPNMENVPRPSMLSIPSEQHSSLPSRVTQPQPNLRATSEYSHDFIAGVRQHTASSLGSQNPSYYLDLLNDPSTPVTTSPRPQATYPQPQQTYSTPQQTYPERAYPPPQPNYNPTNDPYLALFTQSSGYRLASNLNLNRNPYPPQASNAFPSNSSYLPTHASPSHTSAHDSVFTGDNPIPRGRGRGRGRSRGKTPIKTDVPHHHPNPFPYSPTSPIYQPTSPRQSASPSATPASDDAPATKKRKRTNNDKQAKSRQRKADKQEALESEVQRLRMILGALGGCADGEPVTGTNWF